MMREESEVDLGRVLSHPAGKLQFKNKKFEYHGIGSRLDKEEDLKLKMEKFVLSQLHPQMSKGDLMLIRSKMKLEKKEMGITNSKIELFA